MLDRLKALVQAGVLLVEVKGIRRDIQALTAVLTRLAVDVERAYSLPNPDQPQDESRPAVDIAYVSDAEQAELMDIEMRLTTARGRIPTEEEILQEWELRRQGPQGMPQ